MSFRCQAMLQYIFTCHMIHQSKSLVIRQLECQMYCRKSVLYFNYRTYFVTHLAIFKQTSYNMDSNIASSSHRLYPVPWWRHQMETFSALLAICAGNSPVPGEFLAQRPVTRSFDVYFDLSPNKRLSKQCWGWWFETQSRPLWRHRNGAHDTM